MEEMDGLLPDFSLGNGQFSDILFLFTHDNFTEGFYVIGLGDTEVSRSNVFLHSLSLGSIQRNRS